MVLVIDFTPPKNPTQKYTTIQLVLLAFAVILFSSVPLYFFTNTSSSPPWLSFTSNLIGTINFGNNCNMFRGKWVYYPNGASYTNVTCSEIFDHQNCMKFGRPDSEFLKWRWKPKQCELPLFDAVQFLELVRGKSMAFVGDSLGRNHMESLLCLLASAVYPEDIVSNKTDSRFKIWIYLNYNFTLASFWSPYLVKATETEPNGPTYNRLINLYLDETNSDWAAEIQRFDYVIISAGRWFFGPQIFYENGQIVGCHLCQRNGIKNFTMFYGYRKAFGTAFRTLLNLKNYRGITFLRTLSPAHFENGEWNKGGECKRTGPVSKLEMKLDGADLELYETQVEELKAAEREGKVKGLKFRLLDITEAMVVRPDGHPNHYGHRADENGTIADCVHWCLPGPIDTWNAFLLHMLKKIHGK
ncbi:protein trichome birefringence-like 19 [Ziziphus jujuba]|uniref:Protein trichome birefringence-like 19 n=1 Tax=Ziziphus jujuba TaxID=326968 RepID=A0A6P3ZXR9_ZIZJJ|nr:protein trichome birefringence-like 19 [Ziziphus jujuba]